MKSLITSGRANPAHCFNLVRVLACFLIIASHTQPASAAQPQVATQLDLSSATTPTARKFYFETIPGQRYSLWHSTDMHMWEEVAGFPKVADALSLEHTFAQQDREFFSIQPIDEQPPIIVSQYPAAEGFAVGRFADLSIELSDATGIDPASIRLTVGGSGQLSPGAPGLTISGNSITYDSGDAALGAWGETLTATFVAADTLGNTLTRTWGFRLEPEPQVVANVFVFGSPIAQRAGQQVGGPAAALAARMPAPVGPQKADAPPAWSINSVLVDRIVIDYDPGGAPSFPADSYLCNLTPANTDQIFYRKLLSTSDDVQTSRLTLFTVDVPLEELIQQGSASLSRGSVVYQADENGTLVRAFELATETPFDAIGPDLSGQVLWNSGGASLQWDEARWQLAPTVTTSMEFSNFKLQRFAANLRGEIRCALVPGFHYNVGSGFADTAQLAKARRPVFLGFLGVLPVWLELKFNLAASFSSNASAEATLAGGVRQNLDFAFGCTYTRGSSPAVVWNRSITPYPREILPFTYTINGSAGAEIALIPQIDILLNSLAGVSANINPRFGFTGNATLVDGELDSADWSLYARANLNLGMSVVGVDGGSLPSTSISLYSSQWDEIYPAELQIRKHPQSVAVEEGGSASLEVVAAGAKREDIKYQWFQDGRLLPGQSGSELMLGVITEGKTGDYFVKVSAGAETVESDVAVVELTPEFAPESLAIGSSIAYSGVVNDSESGVYADSATINITSATTFTGGTYTYTKTGPDTATLSYISTYSEPDYSESESGSLVLTFTSENNGGFTSSGSYSGNDNGDDFSGNFTGSGSFNYSP